MVISIRPINSGDKQWIHETTVAQWGAETVVGHGTVYYPGELPGFVATGDDQPIGLLTYHLANASCEIITINSFKEGYGVGKKLLEATKELARQHACKRLWLITTNDNLRALGFYQKCGFVLVAVHRNAVEEARKLKPEIPLIGSDGIPLRDEIELEFVLDPS